MKTQVTFRSKKFPPYDGEEEQIKSTQPEGYARFLDHRADEREKLARHPLWSRSPRWMELFDADQRRLSDLQRFFRLPDFAKWHSSHNSTPQT